MYSQFGTSSDARRKRVYYTETSTIYEGMPVCYEFDATANILDYDKAAGGNVTCQTSPGTTAEGNQNEGKFMRVQNPDADNIHAFAGVVAGTSYGGLTGPRWLDIYIPNGAIVPVRTDQNCTVGRTILGIHTAEQHLTGPYSDAGRPVAIAWETLDNSSAAAIVLAKLEPSLFLYQKGDAAALLCDDQDTGNDFGLNKIQVTSAQATGSIGVLTIVVNTVNTDGGSAMYWEYGNTGTGAGGMRLINAYVEAGGTAIAADVEGIKMQTNLLAGSGSTSAATVCGVHAKVHVKGSAGTHEGAVYAARFGLGIDTAVTGNVAQLHFEHTSTAAQIPDYLFEARYEDSVGGLSTSYLTASHGIPVRIEGATYYILLDKA